MDLIAGPANRGRRGDDLGPHLLAVHFPGAELVDGRLVQPDQRAQRPADEMQLVLNDEIGGPQRILRAASWRRAARSPWGCVVAVFDLRGAEAVALAEALDLAEEHLHRAVPRHLGELVHRGNEQRGQAAIDLLVHHHHRQAFVGRCLPAELALAELGPAVDQRPAGAFAVLLDLDMLAGVDLGPAPGAVGQLMRRADAADHARMPGCPPCAALTASSLSLVQFGVVLPPTHRPRRNGVLPQRVSPLLRAVRRMSSQAQIRAAARWNCWMRQQPQRVPHQHGDAVLTGPAFDGALQVAAGPACRPSGPDRLPSCRRPWGTTSRSATASGLSLRSG